MRHPLRSGAYLVGITVAIACLFIVVVTLIPNGGVSSDLSASTHLRALLELDHPGLAVAVAGDGDFEILRAVYARRHFQPLWEVAGRPTPQALATLRLLNGAAAYGLRPEDYRAPLADWIVSASKTPSLDDLQWAQSDLALSVVAVRFLRNVHGGRVDPRAAGFNIGLTPPEFDAGVALEHLATADNVASIINSIEPPFYHYRLLKTALARYQSLAAGSPPPKLPPLGNRFVRPGGDYDGAPILRARLIALGDLAADAAAPDTDHSLDPELVNAIKRFQARNQIDVTGALDAATLRELGTPIAQRVRQIELSLERWRWLPPFQTPPIIVNIPQFRLFAFRSTQDRAADILQMDVIAGRSYPWARTPAFSADMTYVIFRPYWDVPYSITRKELLPKIKADLGYLDTERLEIVSGPDDTARPLPPTPDNLSALASGLLRLRQRPGPNNALGLVKFMLPNPYHVYLHSTPESQLFSKSVRAFSHGCIRVSDPVALAAYVLRDTPGDWTPARIREAMNGATSLRVNLARPIPVVIVYATALATEAGPVLFFHDVYGQDRVLEQLLGLAPVPSD